MLSLITEEKLRDLMEEVMLKLNSANEKNGEEKVEYLTRKQVAEMLDVSLTTVDKYCKDKVLRRYKPAGRVKFIKSEVHEDMRRQNFHY